jgi:hypothetical protein
LNEPKVQTTIELPIDEEVILASIRAIASGRGGYPPSRSQFVSLAKISEHHILRFFPSWNDAVRAAGFEPFTLKVDDTALLEDFARAVRRHGKMPSRRAYLREGKYDIKTIERRFACPWSSVPEVFRKFAADKPEWRDVLALLPPPTPKQLRTPSNPNIRPPSSTPNKSQHATIKDRAVYGEPIHFRGLRHEPVNEHGVILLFGMVAKELGYMVEAMQSGFPDCEAKRQIAPKRWQRVHIEFEFESRNYREHGHPFDGCDVIVCWRHNWEDCPNHIEVLELSTRIQSLPTSES